MSFGIGIGDIFKVCEIARRVYKNCRDCPGEYKTLTGEAQSLTGLLGDIHDKFEKIPESKQQQLFDAYAPCIEVLKELDALLLRYNGLDTKSRRAWDRIKFDPNDLRNLRERLVASVAMLNAFYTSLIHDAQVLVLEALERLERDYRGGHREESIASIERLTSGSLEDDNENDDEEAWLQIIRDLEDVGISQHQALSYRDLIVNWLIKAVNEGRLLEDRSDPDPFSSLSPDFECGLPLIESVDSFSDLVVPTIVKPAETSGPPPSRTPPPIPRPPRTRPPIPQSHLSVAASATSQANSVVSLPILPQDVDSDHSSLYADPERSSLPTPSIRSNVSGASHVPVPQTVSQPQRLPERTPTVPSPQAPSVPILPLDTDAPPSYFEKGTVIVIDMEWTARQAVAAWARHDFVAAEKHLEDQLAAVERGQKSKSGTQPDRRILKHLLGACASLTGKFPRAKQLFENVFNETFLDHQNLDYGEIAAARWLGDLCLHTQEHANAMLAYSIAYKGSIALFGPTSERTKRVAMEIILVDHWLWGFKRIEGTLSLNLDPTSILPSANVVEKNKLLMDVKKSVYELGSLTGSIPSRALPVWGRPSYSIGLRSSTWPLPWDPLFSPMDAVQMDRYMNTIPLAKNTVKPLYDRQIPTNSLGDSKKLHFLTKRGSRWLVNAITQGLYEMGIAHAHHSFDVSIVCCLNQQREGVAYSEGVEICISKLPFRDVYGIKVTDVRWATRRLRLSSSNDLAYKFRSTADFRDMVKGILERAEAEAEAVGRPTTVYNFPTGGPDGLIQYALGSPSDKRGMYG